MKENNILSIEHCSFFFDKKTNQKKLFLLFSLLRKPSHGQTGF